MSGPAAGAARITAFAREGQPNRAGCVHRATVRDKDRDTAV